MKVSKNLKKIRTDRGISQEALAAELFVTRQTVSGWENGRTQPDIETLTKIAEILETDIETLIYGEKRLKKEEDYTKAKRKAIMIIFSVIATVLVTVGVILIFVTGWEKLPNAVKSIFSLIPMLAGQALAIFTFIKKRNNAIWCECSGVAWGAGVIATVALIDSVFGTKIGFKNCLLLDTIMLLPIVYMLDSVIPFAAYYVCSIWFTVNLTGETDSSLLITAVCTVLIFAGVFYLVLNRKNTEKPQFIISLWLSLIAVITAFTITALLICGEFAPYEYYPFAIVAALAICIFNLEKGKIKTKPFENIGSTALIIIGCAGSAMPSLENTFKIEFTPLFITGLAVSLFAAGISFVLSFNSIKTDKLKLTFAVISFVYLIFANISFNMTGIYWAVSVVLSLAMAVCIVAMGVMRTNFFLLNLGLLGTVVQIVITSIMLIDFNMLTGGILMVLMGSALFAVNFLVAKKSKEQKKEAVSNEEQ